MNIRNRIYAGLAATGLALALSIAVPTAAQADYSNNTVVNRSNGWVLVQTDSGNRYWLAGYGTKMTNVDYVVVGSYSCVGISVYKYCATWNPYMVSVSNNAQITVVRLS